MSTASASTLEFLVSKGIFQLQSFSDKALFNSKKCCNCFMKMDAFLVSSDYLINNGVYTSDQEYLINIKLNDNGCC